MGMASALRVDYVSADTIRSTSRHPGTYGSSKTTRAGRTAAAGYYEHHDEDEALERVRALMTARDGWRDIRKRLLA
jgi:hypothetical protein